MRGNTQGSVDWIRWRCVCNLHILQVSIFLFCFCKTLRNLIYLYYANTFGLWDIFSLFLPFCCSDVQEVKCFFVFSPLLFVFILYGNLWCLPLQVAAFLVVYNHLCLPSGSQSAAVKFKRAQMSHRRQCQVSVVYYTDEVIIPLWTHCDATTF